MTKKETKHHGPIRLPTVTTDNRLLLSDSLPCQIVARNIQRGFSSLPPSLVFALSSFVGGPDYVARRTENGERSRPRARARQKPRTVDFLPHLQSCSLLESLMAGTICIITEASSSSSSSRRSVPSFSGGYSPLSVAAVCWFTEKGVKFVIQNVWRLARPNEARPDM